MLKSWLYILLSTLIVSGGSWGSWFIYQNWKEKRASDPIYALRAIVVRSLTEEPVKPAAVAEWLDLSIDRPYNLWKLPCSYCEKKLMGIEPMKQAKVTKIFPSTLMIEIELRQPFLKVGDHSNLVMDKEGISFPLIPYYTLKKLPRVYFHPNEFTLAKKILDYLEVKKINPTLLDLEKANSSSFGEREIVFLEEEIYVRLDPDNWKEGVDQYLKIKKLKPRVADMRPFGMALITGIKK